MGIISREMGPKASESLLPNTAPRNVIVEKTLDEEPDEDPDTTECDCDELKYGAGDAAIAMFIVGPLVVGVWRGTWGIIELHYELFPYAQSLLLGTIVHICFALLRSHLLARSKGAWSKLSGGAGRWIFERFMSRIYTYIFALANILHWYGGFGLFNDTVAAVAPNAAHPHRPALYLAMTIAFYILLVCLRSARNLLASPYFIVTDGKEATYLFTTRFKKSLNSSRETALYVLDCVFSVSVVGSLVVFVWRGTWALLDIFLFPEEPVKSYISSLVVGYGVMIASFSLQAPIRWVVARLHGTPRLLLADVYHFVSFIATVNVWRGVWGMLDTYLFPDTPKLSNWCSHTISLALLILLNCSNSVLVRGVYIDAEEPAGECVIFPCHYLRLFFHKERTKKRHRLALAAAAAASARKSEELTGLPL